MKTTKRLILDASVGLISIGAWIWTFIIDWRISLCLFFIIWGNNISK